MANLSGRTEITLLRYQTLPKKSDHNLANSLTRLIIPQNIDSTDTSLNPPKISRAYKRTIVEHYAFNCQVTSQSSDSTCTASTHDFKRVIVVDVSAGKGFI